MSEYERREYIVSRDALDTLESGGMIGLSCFGPDGYRMIMHDALDDVDDSPGSGWQWVDGSWEYPLREIIRCRDCAHVCVEDGAIHRHWCDRMDHGKKHAFVCRPDGFCAWASPKGGRDE